MSTVHYQVGYSDALTKLGFYMEKDAISLGGLGRGIKSLLGGLFRRGATRSPLQMRAALRPSRRLPFRQPPVSRGVLKKRVSENLLRSPEVATEQRRQLAEVYQAGKEQAAARQPSIGELWQQTPRWKRYGLGLGGLGLGYAALSGGGSPAPAPQQYYGMENPYMSYPGY